jgi:hypothetical protein
MSAKTARERHPFGYSKEQFFWSFLVATMIFAREKKKEEVVYLQDILYTSPYPVALVMDWHADREGHLLCTLLYYNTTLLYIIV